MCDTICNHNGVFVKMICSQCNLLLCRKCQVEFSSNWLYCNFCQRYRCPYHLAPNLRDNRFTNIWQLEHCDHCNHAVCSWCAGACFEWLEDEQRYCGKRVCIDCSTLRLMNYREHKSYGVSVRICYEHMYSSERQLHLRVGTKLRRSVHFENLGITQ